MSPKLAGGTISWRSKKQTIVAISSCKAIYISFYPAAKEAVWLSKVLRSLLGHANPTSICVLVDYLDLLCSAENKCINARSNHTDIRYHFVRQAVSFKQVRLSYGFRDEQAADVPIKSFLSILSKKMRSLLGVVF